MRAFPVYEKVFRVRHYECDARGRLSQAVYLRYMQESAYEASASLGYGMLAYRDTDRSWYIRETDITFHNDAGYGDELVVKTWVEDFQRVRSIRAYEIFTPESKTLLAQARSDWVFLQQSTGTPRSIPVEMVRAFRPDWQTGSEGKRYRFPDEPEAVGMISKMSRQVEWRDLDPVKHVNNSVYLNYLEECGLQAERTAGWSYERLDAENLRIVTQRIQLEYRQPARSGDLLEIDSWLWGRTPTGWKRYFKITRALDGEVIVKGHFHQSWMDLTRRVLVPIPEEVKKDFRVD